MFDTDLFRELIGILLRDLSRAIRAAVIDQDVIPVLVALPEHALNAFWQIIFRIKEWGYETDAWIFWILAVSEKLFAIWSCSISSSTNARVCKEV